MESVHPPSELEQPVAPPQRRRPRVALILLALLLAAGGYLAARWALGLPLFGPARYNSFILETTEPLANFTLVSTDGRPTSLYDFRGRITLLYFGYAYCPDVCPATLATLAKALKELSPAQREQIQVVMVTVDPARDTPELLGEYLGYFDPTFIGLTGTDEQIAEAATPLGIFYAKREVEGVAGYFMDHSASVMVLDGQTRLRLIIPFNMPADQIASDLRLLLRRQ